MIARPEPIMLAFIILRIIGYNFGKNDRMFTSIIKELLGTKIAECNEI